MSSDSVPHASWGELNTAVTDHVARVSEQCIDAYRANPLLVREHANIERGTAEGGYGRRQLYELVQNGADQLLGSSGQIQILFDREVLYCGNEGLPIDVSGVESLLCSHLSNKRGWEIGRFGLGFKSVLGITDCPEFYSRSGSFVFSKVLTRDRIAKVVQSDRYPILRLAYPVNPIEAMHKDSVLARMMSWASTVVKLPLLPGAESWLSDDLGLFPAEFVLFAGHVSKLILDNRLTGKRREIQCLHDKGVVILDEGGQTSVWKVFSTKYRPSDEARKEAGELADRDELPLHWAVQLEGRMGRGKFWAFFPTQYETTLSGILNAPWKTNEDRQNLLPSKINYELIDVAARLAADNIPNLVGKSDPGWILEVLPGRIDESPQWADRLLNSKVYELAKQLPTVPDQMGEMRLPIELNCTPSHLSSSVYEEWASVDLRPADWPHASCESRNRRARLERLFDPEVEPASVRNWLEALARKGSPAHSAAALRTAALIWGSEGSRLHRDEILSANIVLTESGALQNLDPTNLFIANSSASYIPSVPYVSAALIADDVMLQFLRKVGIKEADATGEFTNCFAHGIDTFREKDWKRFWALAAAAGETASRILLARDDLYRVRVRTVSGEFHPVRDVMMPGSIARPGEDDQVAVDLEFHKDSQEILKAIGVKERPEICEQVFDHSWGREYRNSALDEFWKSLTTRQRPVESYLQFFPIKSAGPLDPLFKLSKAGKARFTEFTLSLHETEWSFGHSGRGSYPIIKFPSPSIWLATNYGYLRTSLGLRAVVQCVGQGLNRWSQFLPVVEPDVDVSLLNLPKRLAELSEPQWGSAFVAARDVQDDAMLGAFYSEACNFANPPAKCSCRVGHQYQEHPPESITLAKHQSERDALVQVVRPFVFVEDSVAGDNLIDKWKLRPAHLSVTTEVISVPSGSETSLIAQFPPLRGCAPHIEDYVLIPCSSIREETQTPSGKLGKHLDWSVEEKHIYYLDGR